MPVTCNLFHWGLLKSKRKTFVHTLYDIIKNISVQKSEEKNKILDSIQPL